MYRNNYSTQKPENVLKRIDELIASSTPTTAERNKKIALEQLHTVISTKRKQWTKLFESIMKRHIELCVDLKDHRTAKDGLHQYRNMVQSVDPSSLETIIVYLMELAENRANEARKKSNKVALAAAAKISDLDQEETPESIMLSTMTVDGVKDRTDREVVVPWLKFLWETYRAILELLHKNGKLERVYHKTCEKAFAFCLDYQRTLEFRRLCEMLRVQLSNLQKLALQPVRINRPSWEWTPESIEIHLMIRFNQLEVATSLEQWNESFRTVEEIYSIMQLGKKTPKPRLMAVYYEKLTRIFWVSENYLFHAYAWFRFYNLSCESRKDIKPEDKSLYASSVLLATLCIPSIAGDGASGSTSSAYDDEEIRLEKNQQMALLLDFQSNPSRSALLSEIVTKGLVSQAHPEVRALYEAMETGFRPLQMVKNMIPALDFISAQEKLSVFRLPLQKIAVLLCTRQLSTVYSTVKIDFVKKLFAPLDYSYIEVERMLVDALSRNQLNMRIDHLTGCFRFGTTVSIAPVVEKQLTTTGKKLKEVADKVSNEIVDNSVLAAKRKVYLTSIEVASRNQHTAVIERKMAIERRKEGLERLQRDRQEKEEQRKEVEEAARREEEAKRLKNEEEQRSQAKLKKLQDQLQVQRVKKAMESLGKNVEESALKEMDEKGRKDLLSQAQLEAQKGREDEAKRLSDQARLLDYITRALRIEASEHVVAIYKAQLEKDRLEWEKDTAVFVETQRERHAALLQDKERLARVHAFRGDFETEIAAGQRERYEKTAANLRKKAWEEHRRAKVARARRLKEEEEERLEEEAEAEREYQQKLELEQIQAQQHEELRRQREAELEAIKDKEAERLKSEAEARSLSERSQRADDEDAPGPWRKPAPSTSDRDADRSGGSRWGGGDRGGGDRDADRSGGSRWGGGDRGGGDRDADRGGGSRWGGGDRGGGDRDADRSGGSRWGGGDRGGDRDADRGGGSRWGGGDRGGGDRDADRGGGSRWGGGDRGGGDRDADRGGGSRWGGGDRGGDRDADRGGGSRWGGGDRGGDRDADRGGGSRWGGGDRGGDRDADRGGGSRWGGSSRGPPPSSGPPARAAAPPSDSGGDWKTVPKRNPSSGSDSGGWRKR